MRIGTFDTDQRVLVVAEIGNNHEGDPAVAERLVRAAAEAGAGAVKFQTFRTSLFTDASDKDRYERLTRFELPIDTFARLAGLAHELGLLFLSTPLDLDSARSLLPLVDAYKIASGDNDFYPLLDFVASTGRPVVVSAGLADLDHVKSVHSYIRGAASSHGHSPEIAVLHCVTSYPVADNQAALGAIRLLESELPCTVGYSDHTIGTRACELAVAAGARIIEKHFTLDKQFSSFRDHQLSADPAELRQLTTAVTQVEAMVGPRSKVVQQTEEALTPAVRRTIVAARDLPVGHLLAFDDLMWTRPSRGLRPGQEEAVLGRRTLRDIAFGEPIGVGDVEDTPCAE